MRCIYFTLVIFILLSFSSNAEDFKANSLALPCLGCHGGTIDSSIPIIFGLEQDYIYLSLMDYKLDKREHYLMQLITKGYTSEQLISISKY